MKRIILLFTCLTLLISVTGCNSNKSNAVDTNAVFQEKILELNDGTMLVEPLEGYIEANYTDTVNVFIQNMPSSPEPVVGDIVEITYNGIMTEEAPPFSMWYHKKWKLSKNK